MLVKFGTIIVDGSGTIGGNVIQNGKAGKIMRTKVSPIQPINEYTIQIKDYFKQCQDKWNSFNASIVDEWNIYATKYKYSNVFGDSKMLSGQQLFMKCCLNLFLSNLPLFEHAPESPIPGTNIYMGISTITTTSIILNFKELPSNYNFLRIKATPPLKPGISFYKNRLSLLYNKNPDLTTIDLTNIYDHRFRMPLLGEKIYFEWQVIDIISGIESSILNAVFNINE